MKKMRTILTGTMLVLTLSMLTACGNNGNTTSDEVEKENGKEDMRNGRKGDIRTCLFVWWLGCLLI